MYIHSGYGLSI